MLFMLYLWVLFLYIFLWTSYFQCLRDQEHILGPLELNLQRICKPPCRCKELNPRPLEKQLMLLTSKLFYQPKQQNRRLDQNETPSPAQYGSNRASRKGEERSRTEEGRGKKNNVCGPEDSLPRDQDRQDPLECFLAKGNAIRADMRKWQTSTDEGFKLWVSTFQLSPSAAAHTQDRNTRSCQSLFKPSCPITHACCPLVIFAVECASPSDSPGEQELMLPPLSTQLLHLWAAVFGAGGA